MLPAVALEGVASRSEPASVVVPIPQEHVDVIVRPKPKARLRRDTGRGNVPRAKTRSTPALRVGFSWPVTKAEITSPFGWRPYVVAPGFTGPHPAREFHHGIDILCGLNQPVDAAKGGLVILAGTNLDYGNLVVVQHAGGWSTLYAHLNKLLVRTGALVSSRTRIGLCGMTGRASGVHLHFEVRRLGRFYNPIYFLP